MASTYFGLTFPDLGKINGQLFYCVGQETRKTKTSVQINGSASAPKSHENVRSKSKLFFFGYCFMCLTLFFRPIIVLFTPQYKQFAFHVF